MGARLSRACGVLSHYLREEASLLSVHDAIGKLLTSSMNVDVLVLVTSTFSPFVLGELVLLAARGLSALDKCWTAYAERLPSRSARFLCLLLGSHLFGLALTHAARKWRLALSRLASENYLCTSEAPSCAFCRTPFRRRHRIASSLCTVCLETAEMLLGTDTSTHGAASSIVLGLLLLVPGPARELILDYVPDLPMQDRHLRRMAVLQTQVGPIIRASCRRRIQGSLFRQGLHRQAYLFRPTEREFQEEDAYFQRRVTMQYDLGDRLAPEDHDWFPEDPPPALPWEA